MSDFTRPINGFRFVQTQFGDTLQQIALRELGDASQWSVIAWFNNLIPPYLTDDSSLVGNGVVLTGQSIKVPSSSSEIDAGILPDEVFLVDIALDGAGNLTFSDGDINLVAGRGNLHQALRNLIVTDHYDLVFHGNYGADLGRIIGTTNGPVRNLLAQQYVSEALINDSRVQSVTSVEATSVGDKIVINAEVVPISGVTISLTQTIS